MLDQNSFFPECSSHT